MDKRTIIGIFLIVLVTFLMPYYLRWISGDQPILQPPTRVDSTTAVVPQLPDSSISLKKEAPITSNTETEKAFPEKIQRPVRADIPSDSLEHVFYLETNLIKAKISNQNGGRIVNWVLKKYDHHLGGNVDLIARNDIYGNEDNGLDIELVDNDGNRIQLTDYTMFTSIPEVTSIFLDETNPSAELQLYLPIGGGRIVKKYIFYYDKYGADVIITFEGLQNYIGNRWYSLNWENGLQATEENRKEDYSYARAYAYQNGELETLDVSEDEEEPVSPQGRQTEWTAIRTKYFVAAIIPNSPLGLGVTLSGKGTKVEDDLIKIYSTSLGIKFRGNLTTSHSDTFQVYLGPLDYDVLRKYDVDLQTLVMNKDWYESIFRPISIYIILPAFKFLHGFIPNFGFVIIVFSLLIKLVLHPLTKKSYQSMGEMQYVQPEMTKLREKYKNEPQRLNKEMMKLYKEHGINPLGGCLPTLLQMPLLFALFIVFRSTIQLRGEPFILWITDLSRPDTLSLGLTLPLLGNSIHVLPFLMGATMIWQSKMTMTDPKQKMMVYFMPFFLIFIFYSLPSGLNLYYALFNLLSMFQTRMIKKKMHPDNGVKGKTITQSEKVPKKIAPQKAKSHKSKRRKGQR